MKKREMTKAEIKKEQKRIANIILENETYKTGLDDKAQKTVRKILRYLTKQTWLLNDLTEAEKRPVDFISACIALSNFKDAIGKGGNYHNNIFAACEKEPSSLDRGSHYFSLYYLKNNEKRIVWLYGFFGQDTQNRDRNIRKYIFKSGAIGMRRILDATDCTFDTIKQIWGEKYYMQLDSVL